MLTCNRIVDQKKTHSHFSNSFLAFQHSNPVLAFFFLFCRSWENSFLHYELCCVWWVTWPSYLRLHLKGISHLIVRHHASVAIKNKQWCTSSHWHVVVGPKHIQGSQLLTENTIGFSPSYPSFKQLSKRHDATPHPHTNTHLMRECLAKRQRWRWWVIEARREPAWWNMLMFSIFGQSDLDRRNLCFCIYF